MKNKSFIDIGCNLNDNKFNFFKKNFRFQTGDPSIIDNKKKYLKY